MGRDRGLAELHIFGAIVVFRVLHSSSCWLVLPGLQSSALLQEQLGLDPVRKFRSPSWLRLARWRRLARCRRASLERGHCARTLILAGCRMYYVQVGRHGLRGSSQTSDV